MSSQPRPWSVLVCLACLVGPAAALAEVPRPATTPATRPAAAVESTGFAGEWDTTFGLMRLTRSGDAVDGTYQMGGTTCTIRGRLSGSQLRFTYKEPGAAGEGEFELAADGNSFAGKWRQQGDEDWQQWSGRRRGTPEVARGPFDGLWNTSFGRMRLTQTGDAVRGAYSMAGGSSVEGKADGRSLTFKYDQPDGEKGEGTFELAPDGQSFTGTWKGAKGVARAGGKWTGSRIKPEPGKVWLVVLEHPWEHELAQNEYSFGLMLRTFFARTPHVQVRHKFFHDEADFRRWCAEIPYLAEPVVLHVSSHGTQKGVSVGRGGTIGADVLALCLKDAGNIKLLHFGTCLICSGDVPTKLHEAGCAFPISGYARPADWGGSAVIDFTYLDLIFSKNLSPAAAARETKKMLSFANEKANGDAIAPAGLVFIEPPKAGAKAAKAE